MKKDKGKTKKTKKWIEYGFLALFIGLLFTTDLKAEVFGFVQRGFLKLGFFQPDIMDDINPTDPKVAKPYEKHNLILKSQNGKTLNVAELRDKVVFINFWATWCPPCIAEMPNINKLYRAYQEDDEVVFLMISLDKNFSKAKQFLKRKEYDFDIYEPQNSLPREFQSRGIPNTFVLGKDGKIEFTHMGMGSYNTTKFKNFLEDLKAK